MTKDEATTSAALELALEVLEQFRECDDPEHEDWELAHKAITTIKEALAQPTTKDYALGYAEGFNDACKPKPQPDYRAVKTYHEGRPVYVSQPEQEPKTYALLYPQAEYVAIPEQEPVERLRFHSDMSISFAPPKRPWVGLTDEEFDEIWRMDLNNKDIMDKTIAKLKELNT